MAQARGKGLYDPLEARSADYLTEEAKIGARYHLVLAADVFMYFDDLGPVLKPPRRSSLSGTACVQWRRTMAMASRDVALRAWRRLTYSGR
jgi:predicted TPR repeat methyltransferase